MNTRDINIYFDVSSGSWIREIKSIGDDWVFDGAYASKSRAEYGPISIVRCPACKSSQTQYVGILSGAQTNGCDVDFDMYRCVKCEITFND